MKKFAILLLAAAALTAASCSPSSHKTVAVSADPLSCYSIRSFGVLPENSPELNRKRLQEAIDWAADRGAALYVEPVKGGYPVRSGIVLKKNVSLVGVHGPTGRGTVCEGAPTGSLFVITDKDAPFITVESATQIRGCQFYYPLQPNSSPEGIEAYPPTISVSRESKVNGVTLSCLSFYGEYFAMDFRASREFACEQILFEHCYGYPLSGEFIAVDYCYDIPRMLHCHVNPANMREFGRTFDKSVIDHVVARRNYTFWIDHTDNAQCMDLFTFGNYGGLYLGPATYGQLTNFNFDCVTNGIFKGGDSQFNRVWEVAQGSIIANASPAGDISEIHPISVSGKGHLSLVNVDCFSGDNPVITNQRCSEDFIRIESDEFLVVTGVNCRMRNYRSDCPVSVDAPKARISFLNCTDKDGNIFNWSYGVQ